MGNYVSYYVYGDSGVKEKDIFDRLKNDSLKNENNESVWNELFENLKSYPWFKFVRKDSVLKEYKGKTFYDKFMIILETGFTSNDIVKMLSGDITNTNNFSKESIIASMVVNKPELLDFLLKNGNKTDIKKSDMIQYVNTFEIFQCCMDNNLFEGDDDFYNNLSLMKLIQTCDERFVSFLPKNIGYFNYNAIDYVICENPDKLSHIFDVINPLIKDKDFNYYYFVTRMGIYNNNKKLIDSGVKNYLPNYKYINLSLEYSNFEIYKYIRELYKFECSEIVSSFPKDDEVLEDLVENKKYLRKRLFILAFTDTHINNMIKIIDLLKKYNDFDDKIKSLLKDFDVKDIKTMELTENNVRCVLDSGFNDNIVKQMKDLIKTCGDQTAKKWLYN